MGGMGGNSMSAAGSELNNIQQAVSGACHVAYWSLRFVYRIVEEYNHNTELAPSACATILPYRLYLCTGTSTNLPLSHFCPSIIANQRCVRSGRKSMGGMGSEANNVLPVRQSTADNLNIECNARRHHHLAYFFLSFHALRGAVSLVVTHMPRVFLSTLCLFPILFALCQVLHVFEQDAGQEMGTEINTVISRLRHLDANAVR